MSGPKPRVVRDEIPEYVKQRIDRLALEASEAKARAAALEAKVGVADPLLVELAEALQLAELASDPLQGRNLDTVKVAGSKDRPLPGASTASARRAARRLRTLIERALQEFDTAREHHWFPPKPAPVEKVRCGNDRCTAVNKRIPRFVGQAMEIELVRCPKCDSRLYATP